MAGAAAYAGAPVARTRLSRRRVRPGFAFPMRAVRETARLVPILGPPQNLRGAAPELSQKLGAATTESLRRTNIAQVESHVKQNRNLNPKKLSAVRSFYKMLLNSRKRLKTQGFKQVNHSFPLIRSHPILRASRELAREKSREDIGFWNVKDKASVDCRDVTSQQTCTLYQPKTSYKTGKRTSEDARFFILWR